MRECGVCRACCEGWLIIDNETIKARPGEPCKHVINEGCAIYSSRPEVPCKNFNCSWVKDESNFPDWMQPSNSKAIVVNSAINWRGNIFDLVVPVGKRVPPRTLKWLTDYANLKCKPFVYAEHVVENKVYVGAETKVIAPQPLRDNLVNWLKAGNRLLMNM